MLTLCILFGTQCRVFLEEYLIENSILVSALASVCLAYENDLAEKLNCHKLKEDRCPNINITFWLYKLVTSLYTLISIPSSIDVIFLKCKLPKWSYDNQYSYSYPQFFQRQYE